MTIAEMIAAKEARKTDLAAKAKASTDVSEVRGINEQIDALNTDILNLRSAIPVPDATAVPAIVEPAAPVVELRGITPVGQFQPLGTYQIGEQRETTPTVGGSVYATPEYRSAFLKTLMKLPLTDAEKRTYIDSGAAGAVIPTQTSNMFFDKMVKVAPMINEITLMRVAGNVRIAVQGTRADAAQHTENAAVTPASDTFAYIDLAGYEFIKVQRVSATVSTMSVDGFETWLVNLLAEDVATQIENAIINGNGSTAPKGIEYANTWVSGSNGIDYGTNVIYDNLVDLTALLPARYDAGAKFLMNKAMFYQQIMKIKDAEGNPIVLRDVTNAAAMRILGYPVLISDKVAAGVAYLGNFTKVIGNLAQDVQVDSSAASGFLSNAVDYRGVAIFDCDIALADAIVKLFT